MKTQREIHNELHNKWCELNEIKIGDTVKVINMNDPHNILNEKPMFKYLGKEVIIKALSENGTLICDGNWHWPYYCLEKVWKEKPKKVRVHVNSSNLSFIHEAVELELTKDGFIYQGSKHSLENVKAICKASHLLQDVNDGLIPLGWCGLMISARNVEQFEKALKQFE